MKKRVGIFVIFLAAMNPAACAMDEMPDFNGDPAEIDSFLAAAGVEVEIFQNERAVPEGGAPSGVFQCPKLGCRKKFTNKGLYEGHLVAHAKVKRYLCPEPGCGKYLANGSLPRHRRIHTGEKPYTCKTCGRKFRDGSNLKSHTLGHAKEKPFKCTVPGCSSAYVIRRYLVRHQRKGHKQTG